MIERYTLKEMGEIWQDKNKYAAWLRVELAVCKAYVKLGEIPPDVMEDIEKKADFDVERINEIEKEVKHDVIAFLTSVAEYVGENSRFIHMGMTSSDMLDTSLALLMKQAGEKLLERIENLEEILRKKAKEHKETFMIGRTHGVHSEPITLGLKLAIWFEETKRNRKRLQNAVDSISVGKISGAVGTYAFINPQIELMVCEELGIKASNASSQIVQRDRHAEFMNALAVTASSLEKFATEIRNLQRTEIGELEEYFSKGQKGSSAMPHKKNPITCERVSGLARILRGNALAAMENIPLWHERDISHSSVERIIIPDSTILLDYMLYLMTDVIDKLVVNKDIMNDNIFLTQGIIFSQSLLLELIKKGLTREESYKLVQENAMNARNKGTDFKSNVTSDFRIKEKLTEKEINGCFDLTKFLKNIDHIFKRVGFE
ncbi:adenylosuccinate lyase [candidate division KSB1 bacterium]